LPARACALTLNDRLCSSSDQHVGSRNSDGLVDSIDITEQKPATMPVPQEPAEPRPERSRRRVIPGRPALGIVAATVGLFAFSWAIQPQSVSHSSLLGMLPFAGVLAIAAMGQTLVIQQGGIDLSVPGMLSLTVVVMTHFPDGGSGKLVPALA